MCRRESWRPAIRAESSGKLATGASRGSSAPPGLDGALDPGGELAIHQQLVDQRGQHLLSGHAGKTEAIGGISLPDVEGSVLGRGEIDRTACSAAARLADGDA